MKRILLTGIALLIVLISYAQDVWTKKENFVGSGRYGATGFSINLAAYIATGYDGAYKSDVWQYTPISNTWTQKADYGGGGRWKATGFSIGDKGYVGTGIDNTGSFTNDFWEFDPEDNEWTRKTDFGGSGRFGATSFRIGNMGYLGTGYDGNNNENDFWEYDPGTDSWSRKADFPGAARNSAAGFSIENIGYGYIGTGYSVNGYAKDFWEYTPGTNTWARKADFGGSARGAAIAFCIGNKGYIGSGDVETSYASDFWQYDPEINTWVQKASFGGTPRYAATGFTIGSKGYIVTGDDAVFKNDFWEYDPRETWTQKANFGGIGRSNAVSFCIEYLAFTGTGINSSGYLDDFWEYNFYTGAWTQKADFGGGKRFDATGFSIGGAGFVGLGYGGAGYLNDFWKYDYASNFWFRITDFAGGARGASTGFSIGKKGYIAMGTDGAYKNDVWEYDYSADTWTRKADFGGNARVYAASFVIGSKGYIGTGQLPPSVYVKDFWEYDPVVDTWTKKADFGGSARYGATGFSIGGRGYMGTGYDGSFKKDIWEYDPDTGTWVQKNDFAGTGRSAAIGVSLLNKGYIGLGYDGSYEKDLWEYRAETQKASLLELMRAYATTFTIDGKAYIGTGYYPRFLETSVKNDFWEYNPVNDTWTQKVNFEGSSRYLATGFSLGGKGYIGTGFAGSAFSDFWEYDPVANTWVGKADFPGARYGATGFSIGNKGYIGTGDDGTPKNDFWEYNPGTDTWTQKADYGGAPRSLATGFSIGSKGYIGTGYDGSSTLNDFWEYEPSINAWTKKADFPGGGRYTATGFNIDERGYIGLGAQIDKTSYNVSTYNDFWEYNPIADTWTQQANFSGGSRSGAAGFVIGSKAYIGTGTDGSNYMYDFWLFSPKSSIYTKVLTGNLFCAGSVINVPFTKAGTFTGSNVFTAQLSDAMGSFASPVNIGTFSSTTAGTISAILPPNTPPGNGYRIRVVSTNPGITGTDNGTNLSIVTLAATISPAGTTNVCSGTFFVLSANSGTGINYQWLRNGVPISGAKSQTYSASLTGDYTVSETNTSGCTSVSAATTVKTGKPTATITPLGDLNICTTGSVTLQANTGNGFTYQWQKGSSSIAGATNSTYTATAAATYKVIVTIGAGCSQTSAGVTVTSTKPAATITPLGDLNICTAGSVTLQANSGTGLTYQWQKGTGNITGATSSTYTATTAGNYKVIVTAGAGCSQTSAGVTVISTKPNATITPLGDLNICATGSVTLQANTGTGLTYQWQKGSTNIAGATGSTYTATSAGTYKVVITVSAGCSQASAGVTVTAIKPTATIIPPADLNICNSGSVVLQANTGTGLAYQWQKGNTNIAGATNSTYTATTAGTYKVIVSIGTGCNQTSASVTVTSVAPAATIMAMGNLNICSAGSVVLQANTAAGLTYQWQKAGANISGATNRSYTATTTGTYKVIVTSSGGCSKTSTGTAVTKSCSLIASAGQISSPDLFALQDELSLYPNPSAGNITVRFSSNNAGRTELTVHDALERVVFSKRNEAVIKGNNTFQLNLSNLVPGVYYLQISNDGNQKAIKFILER